MDLKKRVELFLLLKVKMEEVMAIIDEHGARDEFLASYCFGLSTNTPLDIIYKLKKRINATLQAGS